MLNSCKDMKILAIETTGKYGSASVIDETGLVCSAASSEEMNHLKGMITLIDEALRKAGYKVLSIFIAAPLSQRVARTCRLQGFSKEECLELTERKDSSRKAYYEKHTGRKWGVPESYDLYYDTSENDIAYIIVDIIKKYKELCSE